MEFATFWFNYALKKKVKEHEVMHERLFKVTPWCSLASLLQLFLLVFDNEVKKFWREPFINELHKATHTYEIGQYVDEYSKICQEEYDKQLAISLSRGCLVYEALALKTWTRVSENNTKGQLYAPRNLIGDYQRK